MRFPVKGQVLIAGHISQLVADTSGMADNLVYITVGMTVNPVFNRTVCNKVPQLDSKGPV